MIEFSKHSQEQIIKDAVEESIIKLFKIIDKSPYIQWSHEHLETKDYIDYYKDTKNIDNINTLPKSYNLILLLNYYSTIPINVNESVGVKNHITREHKSEIDWFIINKILNEEKPEKSPYKELFEETLSFRKDIKVQFKKEILSFMNKKEDDLKKMDRTPFDQKPFDLLQVIVFAKLILQGRSFNPNIVIISYHDFTELIFTRMFPYWDKNGEINNNNPPYIFWAKYNLFITPSNRQKEGDFSIFNHEDIALRFTKHYDIESSDNNCVKFKHKIKFKPINSISVISNSIDLFFENVVKGCVAVGSRY